MGVSMLTEYIAELVKSSIASGHELRTDLYFPSVPKVFEHWSQEKVSLVSICSRV
jgi:hypothetical protein